MSGRPIKRTLRGGMTVVEPPSVGSGRHPRPRTDRSTAKRRRLRTPPSSHPSVSRLSLAGRGVTELLSLCP